MSRRASIAAALAAMALASVIRPVRVGAQPAEPEGRNRERQETTERDRKDWRISDAEEALTQARQILGLPDKMPPGSSATLVTLAEDTTPFLSEKLVGRPIWQVVLADWPLELPSAAEGAQDRFPRTFDVFVDPKDGSLLKLASRWPEGVPAIAPEPEAAFAEEQMGRAGLERYHGFPESKPAVDFIQALDVVYKQGVGNPLEAKQIIAHCVERSAMGKKPRAVWAITLRGIPPLRAAYPGVPVDARNHIRNIVDANTGEWLCAGTSPQPQEGDNSETKDEAQPGTEHP